MRRAFGIAVIALLAVTAARSSIVYVDLPDPEGFLGIGPGNPFTRTFDFDRNGTIDLEFTAGVDIFGFYVVGPEGAYTRVVAVSGFGVVPMQFGEEIGSLLGPTANPRAALFPSPQEWFALTGYSQLSHTFNDSGNVTGGPWHPFDDAYGEDAYLGFEFQAEDGIHYGWIRIHEFAGVGGFFREYAYESRPGVPILAGAKPVVIPLKPPQIARAGYLRLQWEAVPGTDYQVQAKDRLDAFPWRDLEFVLPATSNSLMVDLPMKGDAQFFRVIKAD